MGLAAGQRPGGAVEVEVVEADAEQKVEAPGQLAHDLRAGGGPVAGRVNGVEERSQFVEVHLPELVDGLAVDQELEPCRAQARAVTVGADVLHHHAVEPGLHARVRDVALTVPAVVALDAAGDPLESKGPAQPTLLADLGVRRNLELQRLAAGAVQDQVAGLVAQVLPRRVEIEAVLLGQRVEGIAAVIVGTVVERVAQEATVLDTALRVRDEEVRMRALVRADAATGPAGALRVIEHEEIRHDVAVDERMPRAAERLRKARRLAGVRAADDGGRQQRVADAQGMFDAGLELLLDARDEDEAIHHGRELRIARQCVRHVFGEVDPHGRLATAGVDVHVAAAELADLVEDELGILAVDLEDRRTQLDLGTLGELEERLQDLRGRLHRHRLVGVRAVTFADGGEKQVQVARDVGERTDGGPGVAADGLLLDGDHGRQAVDEVHVRLLHLGDEALGVGGQRLHVAALALGVDGVEGERRLAGAGQARDYREFVAGDLDRDVLEVVDPGALHGDGRAHRRAGDAVGLVGVTRRHGKRPTRRLPSGCAW